MLSKRMSKRSKESSDCAVPTGSARGVSPEFAAILRTKEQLQSRLYDMKLKKPHGLPIRGGVDKTPKRSSWLKDAVSMCLELERRHPRKNKAWRYTEIATTLKLTEKTVARALDKKLPRR